MKSFGPFDPLLFLGFHGATDSLSPRFGMGKARPFAEPDTPGDPAVAGRPTGIPGPVPPPVVALIFRGIRKSEPEAPGAQLPLVLVPGLP